MGSQSGGGTQSPLVDWIAVLLIVLGASIGGFGLIIDSLWVGLVGVVVAAAGAIMALGSGIMQHTEDYEGKPQQKNAQRVL